MSSVAIKELRELLSKEIDSKRVEAMTDEDISFIGFFLLEIFKQGLNLRK